MLADRNEQPEEQYCTVHDIGYEGQTCPECKASHLEDLQEKS